MKELKLQLIGITLATLLTACPPVDDTGKPSAAITSPASDASVSSTVPVQIDATDNNRVSRVEVYARGRGSTAPGLLIGSAVSAPYVISWNTLGVPNAADLELYASAFDTAGNKGDSSAVRVKTANQNVPNLNYLVAYTLPPRPVGITSARVGTPSSITGLDASTVLPPQGLNAQTRTRASQDLQRATAQRSPRAEPVRTFALEWSWQAFQSIGGIAGVDGYGIFSSDVDLAGSYTRVVSQAASTNSVQKISKNFADAFAGKRYFGAVTAIQNNKTTETGYSNGDGAIFLPANEAISPADNATVSDGRPLLQWQGVPGATGYLYFVYDKNPWDSTAQLKWGNSPQSTDQLSAPYPGSRASLPSGKYYWWVAGVGFDVLNKADSFSFSEPRAFIVP